MLKPSQSGPWVPRHLVGFDLRRRPHLDADVLVVGGGVAGLSAALAAAEAGREVLLLAKASITESNTRYAQGGVTFWVRGNGRVTIKRAGRVSECFSVTSPGRG